MMEGLPYQGLFYLSTGVGAFISLLLGFRVVADGSASQPRAADQDGWLDKELLEVTERVEECDNVVTLRLRRTNGQVVPRFRAGQFLSVQIGNNERATRSYSICSSALIQHNLQISVKRIANGLGSTWMHGLREGDKIWAYPPSGHFVDDQLENETRIYVAGGIGITPIISMVQSNIDAGRRCEMFVFYGMRTERDLAFHATLENLARRHPRVHYFPLLSEDRSAWNYDRGFITFDYIQKKAQPAPSARYFICGPTVMTEPLMDRLLEAGVPEEQIFNERFVSPQSLELAGITPRQARVVWEGRTLQYNGKQPLLDFFEAEGVQLPFACRSGVCGSCKCRIEGKTKILSDAGLTRAERKAGYVLTCVAFPDDVELKILR